MQSPSGVRVDVLRLAQRCCSCRQRSLISWRVSTWFLTLGLLAKPGSCGEHCSTARLLQSANSILSGKRCAVRLSKAGDCMWPCMRLNCASWLTRTATRCAFLAMRKRHQVTLIQIRRAHHKVRRLLPVRFPSLFLKGSGPESVWCAPADFFFFFAILMRVDL